MDADRQLGGVGTKMLFEDERIRVWHLKLAPGEDSPIHRHELDHVLIQIAGDRIAVVPEPDSQGPYRDYMEAPVIPGAVVAVSPGGVELARNVGEQNYLEVIIELKD